MQILKVYLTILGHIYALKVWVWKKASGEDFWNLSKRLSDFPNSLTTFR